METGPNYKNRRGIGVIKMKRLFLLMIAVVVCIAFCSCSAKPAPDFTSISSICELATLECYYHNVATYEDQGWNFIISVGNKKAWIEYDGIIKIGIDGNKVVVHEPNKENVIEIEIPKSQVLSVNVDSDSILSNNIWRF